MKTNWRFVLAVLAAAAGGTMFFTGCEKNNPGDPNAAVTVNFTGNYRNGGGSITAPPLASGAVTELDLTQQGTVLDAVDNFGTLYTGSLGSVPETNNPTASFSLRSAVMTNGQINITGTLRKTAATVAQMTGTWITPGSVANISATAAVSATVSNTAAATVVTNVTVVITNDTSRFPLR